MGLFIFIQSCVVRHCSEKCITRYVIFRIACLIPVNRVVCYIDERFLEHIARNM